MGQTGLLPMADAYINVRDYDDDAVSLHPQDDLDDCYEMDNPLGPRGYDEDNDYGHDNCDREDPIRRRTRGQYEINSISCKDYQHKIPETDTLYQKVDIMCHYWSLY